MKSAQCVGAGSTFGDSGGARLCDPSLCRGWLHCATAATAAAVTAATATAAVLAPAASTADFCYRRAALAVTLLLP